jgi:diacylglycerol diphosphate phosphatase/phosphatidate phosphatase
MQRHHKEDIVVGSFIGIVSALLSYMIFWPSPFITSSFNFSTYGRPRLLYTEENTSPEHTELQLTSPEDDVLNTIV